MKYEKKVFEKQIADAVKQLERDTRFSNTKKFIQHGNVTVFTHCVCVAYVSCHILKFFHIRANLSALIMGALLHDYFLYDWHDGELCRKIHGFTHPFKACKNAKEDVKIGKIEENIIKRHMFPLVPVPPKYIESWIVCAADKICALEETINGHCTGKKRRFVGKLMKKENC